MIPRTAPKLEPSMGRFAELLELDAQRVRPWLFARAAAEPREDGNDERLALARVLAP